MSNTRRADSAVVASVLARGRRRMILARVWRDASIATPIAAVLAELIVLLGGRAIPTVSLRWSLAVAAATIALTAAVIRALIAPPTLNEVASTIDRRLGLGERLTTAAQVLGQDDGFAQLVERDAAARLTRFRPARALPFETPRAALAMTLVAVAVPALFLAGAWIYEGDWNRGLSTLSSRIGLEIPSPATDDAAAVTSAATPQAGSRPAQSEEARRSGVELQPRAPESGGASAPRQTQTSSPSQSTPESGARDSAGASTVGRQSPGATADAGGVAAGSLASSAAATPAKAERDEAAPTYRSAWSRAQSAVAVDRVPADRRLLVKRYFSAIRPSESQ